MNKKINAANCVTLIRLLLVLALNYMLATSHGQFKTFFLILCFLLLNYIGDILDGYLARIFNQVSMFGAILDVSVDALLVLGAYFILAYRGVIKYYLFYITLASLLQFILSSLWIKKLTHKKPVFTFDALGHYSAVLIEAMLIFNIGAEFITSSVYVKTISYVDFVLILLGAIATLNRFRYYFMVSSTMEA